MTLGPYRAANDRLAYEGNKQFQPMDDIQSVAPPSLSRRHLEVRETDRRWSALMRLWDAVLGEPNVHAGTRLAFF